ncbi:post-transcriptional regulator [Lottiidibacillus patelloidae]|nr:post-transcriptional regulator [Lottiidibacillus patelloidae]
MLEQNMAVWKERALPVITSKLEELHMLGYERATVDEIWKVVLKKRKKKTEEPLMHDLINDILRVTPTDYMNWLTTEAITNDDWMSTFEDFKKEN